MNLFTQRGWQCPLCQRVYSPTTPTCFTCPPKVVTTSTTSIPPKHEPMDWQPIGTAPKDGSEILLMYMHIETQVVHAGFWIGEEDTIDVEDVGWWSYEYSEVSRIKLHDWMEPTHWMPLPKPPAAHGIGEKK